MFNLESDGDYLEKKYYWLINRDFIAYKDFWESIVGNDGNNLIPTDEKESDFYRRRSEISQLSYTILESFTRLFEINDKIISIENYDDYFQAMDSFILFFTHFGRIVDCIRKMPYNMKSNLSLELNNLYEKRNNVLHGKKVPFRVTDTFLQIPEISDLTTQSPQSAPSWTDKLNWNQFENNPLEFSNDIYGKCYSDMKDFLNAAYNKIKAEFLTKYSDEMKRIKLLERNNSTVSKTSSFRPYTSGSVFIGKFQ